MRYVQLRAFHHVAICGGFSRAAQRLHLTQPAISDQVRKLEEEYDLLLFDRQKKQVALTPAGARLLDITRRLFEAEDQAQDLLAESRALRAGHLRIMADSAHHLLHVLVHFRAKYPGVRITVQSGNSGAVIRALHRYDADVGVLGEMPADSAFQALLLNSSPIMGFVAKSHPLAGKTGLSFQDLARAPLVMREQGSKTRRKLEQAAQAAGVPLLAAIEAEGREAVREIVASGAGIGFVSAAEFGLDPRLIAIPLHAAKPAPGPQAGLMMDEALICLHARRGVKLVAAFFDIARGLAQVPPAPAPQALALASPKPATL